MLMEQSSEEKVALECCLFLALWCLGSVLENDRNYITANKTDLRILYDKINTNYLSAKSEVLNGKSQTNTLPF